MAAKAMSSARLIYPARTVGRINIEGVDLFEVRWAPYYAYAMNTGNAIENPYHPRHLLAHRRWNQRTEPLWWNCLTSIAAGGKKSVVRNWFNRRTRVAIVNALQRRGYGKDGSRLPDSSADSEKEDLIGSLHLFTTSKMLRARWDEVSKQADLVIEGIERKQKNEAKRRRRKSL